MDISPFHKKNTYGVYQHIIRLTSVSVPAVVAGHCLLGCTFMNQSHWTEPLSHVCSVGAFWNHGIMWQITLFIVQFNLTKKSFGRYNSSILLVCHIALITAVILLLCCLFLTYAPIQIIQVKWISFIWWHLTTIKRSGLTAGFDSSCHRLQAGKNPCESIVVKLNSIY